MNASQSVQRVHKALGLLKLETELTEFPDSTRTAPEAAAAVGCELGQIVKSIVFRAGKTDTAILAIMSGVNRVDEKKLGAVAGVVLKKADADFVRAVTGFAIGGVSPVGHTGDVKVFFDEDLRLLDPVWAAAGTPFTVMCLSRQQVDTLCANTYYDLAKRQ